MKMQCTLKRKKKPIAFRHSVLGSEKEKGGV